MTPHEPYWPMTDQQKQMQQTAREFAGTQIAPRARELDDTAAFAGSLYAAMARLACIDEISLRRFSEFSRI